MEWHNRDRIYTAAKAGFALVSASKLEGFGLPLIEAMTQGVPVICSDTPIFHEVAGNAGLFFNPTSPEAFVSAVYDMEIARDDHVKRSLQQAKKFNWNDSARRLLAIIKGL